MKILISEIPDEGLDIDIDEKFEADVVKLTTSLKGNLKISRVGSEVAIRGDITAAAGLVCSRCLKDYTTEVRAEVNVIYHPVEELRVEGKHEVKEDELEMGFYSGDEFDLTELLKEQMILNMPMKPLCSEACKGICSKCGTDLNINKCGCSTDEIDSRLEVLKELLRKGQ